MLWAIVTNTIATKFAMLDCSYKTIKGHTFALVKNKIKSDIFDKKSLQNIIELL